MTKPRFPWGYPYPPSDEEPLSNDICCCYDNNNLSSEYNDIQDQKDALLTTDSSVEQGYDAEEPGDDLLYYRDEDGNIYAAVTTPDEITVSEEGVTASGRPAIIVSIGVALAFLIVAAA